MHNRRLGSLLIGIWLMGTVLVWFVKSQTVREVGLFSTTSLRAEKEVATIGKENAERLLRDFSVQYNRHLQEMWEIVQLCTGGALFLISLLTSFRSRTVLVATAAMIGIVAIMAFYITPSLNTLQMRLDTPGGLSEVRTEEVVSLRVWHRVLEIIKIALALLIAVRLVFDLQGLGLPYGGQPGRQKSGRQRPPEDGSDVSPSHVRARQ